MVREGLYDQHVHSWNSVDCKADPAEVADRAVAAGLAGLTFTEHYDRHPTERSICIYDYERIAATVAGLRDTHGPRLFVGLGIEVCYQPAQMAEILGHLSEHTFDMTILSVHWFDERALHEKAHWTGLDTYAATRRYLLAVLEAARLVLDLKADGRQPFHVLGHLDLVKRYTQRYFSRYEVRQCRELVAEILRVCLAAELVPELNMSTLRQSVPEPMPAAWAVELYAELGGRAMSLGSDAHQAEHVGAGLTEGVELLKAAGVTHQAVFADRQRHELPL